MKKRAGEKQHRRKQGRVCTYVNRKPKAVDEDLYRVPPELLYQIPKKVLHLLKLSPQFSISKKFYFIQQNNYKSYYPKFLDFFHPVLLRFLLNTNYQSLEGYLQVMLILL